MRQSLSRTVFAFGLGIAAISTAQTVVFDTDFDTSLPPQIDPGVALREGVQGYAGLGTVGNQFGGLFLRSPTGSLVTLTLTGLPPHNAINLDFLFAAIDSLDGTGEFPQGDFFRVELDGVVVFRESFANALPSQTQSYIPPAGGTLARHENLGFTVGIFYLDSAYDMSIEPAFDHLPHTASTAVFTFQMEGPGIQDLNDESWAFDNLRISVDAACAADLTGDGVLDFFDLQQFLQYYASGDDRADFADDGVLDFFDVLAFLNAYAAGCP